MRVKIQASPRRFSACPFNLLYVHSLSNEKFHGYFYNVGAEILAGEVRLESSMRRFLSRRIFRNTYSFEITKESGL